MQSNKNENKTLIYIALTLIYIVVLSILQWYNNYCTIFIQKLTGINTELEQFSIECCKTKTKVLRSITKDTNNAVNQWKLKGTTCS